MIMDKEVEQLFNKMRVVGQLFNTIHDARTHEYIKNIERMKKCLN